jgi:hypothetical protein
MDSTLIICITVMVCAAIIAMVVIMVRVYK